MTAVVAPLTVSNQVRLTPGWPVAALLGLTPLWWFTGMTPFIWPILAVPMALSLLHHRGVVVAPRTFAVWGAFLVWMLASFTQIDTGGRALGFLLRTGSYLAATTLLLYVVNLGNDGIQRVARALVTMWAIVVAFGLAALVIPDVQFTTLVARVVPAGLRDNDFVATLLQRRMAQVHEFLGFPVPRPAAPFTYTNDWGASFAVLTPLAIGGIASRTVTLPRNLLRVLLVAAAVPAIISLNRGLWLSLGAGMLYAAVRFAGQRAVKPLMTILFGLTVLGSLLFLTPLGGLVQDRLETGHSNEARAGLYEEAIDRTNDSPVLGYGAPRPSEHPNRAAVGTQGQLWMVLFSHGYPGAVLYCTFLLALLWHTRKAPTPLAFWAHVSVFIGVVQIPFYGQVPEQLHYVFAAAGVALLESRRAARDGAQASWAT